ncbi:hypothetical protein [Microbacterium sp. AK031]|uniref:hypothetical protein n=1 Tax=Microbacterium sp. AK031 TaxID=2723076 RepID=UPI002169FC78|nr:hypothetical protein [Microbacterium sp. AK031]MCS3843521.1 hypothetical protein [Microbacterium sp. AK031]
MAYQENPIEHVSVQDLHLDVTNYRFANAMPSESAAMNYLWAEQKVDEVARLILRDGYVDNELPIVVRENNQWILLEGNRRVSALLVLHTPTLAPAHQTEVEQLKKRFAIEAASLPSSIRVMVFANREAAAPVLARLHIGQPKKAWNLDEQAKFVLAQLTHGTSIDQLRAQLPAIKDIPRVVRMGRVRERLLTTTFSSAEVTSFVQGTKLAMSSFEYAYRNPQIQKLIGLEFDSEARVAKWATSDSEIRALEKLLDAFRTGEINTRRGLKAGTPEYDELIRAMKGSSASSAPDDAGESDSSNDKPKPGDSSPAKETTDSENSHEPPTSPVEEDDSGESERGGGTDGGLSTQPSDPASDDTSDAHEAINAPSEDDGESTRRGPNAPDTKANVSLNGIDESTLPLPLQHRMRELRRINVVEFPAAAAMLVRSVVEASIKEHYGSSNGLLATGTLGDVMQIVTADQKGNGQLAHAISQLNRTKKEASHAPGTGQWFNLVTHSVNLDISGQDVHTAWRVVYPLVRFMLTERSTSHSSPPLGAPKQS